MVKLDRHLLLNAFKILNNGATHRNIYLQNHIVNFLTKRCLFFMLTFVS